MSCLVCSPVDRAMAVLKPTAKGEGLCLAWVSGIMVHILQLCLAFDSLLTSSLVLLVPFQTVQILCLLFHPAVPQSLHLPSGNKNLVSSVVFGGPSGITITLGTLHSLSATFSDGI
jgi:hypothetical protein